jgi:hypothetical protein
LPEYLSTNPQTDICRNELENMLSGLPYSKSDLSSQDEISLRVVSEILINEMSGNKPDRRERAREAFMELGLFRTWSEKSTMNQRRSGSQL